MTPELARAARIAAAALLQAEIASLRLLRAHVRRSAESLAASLAPLPVASRRRAVEQAVRHLHAALPGVTAAVWRAVAQGRAGAKASSIARLQVEWRLVQRAVAAAGHEPPGDIDLEQTAVAEDEAAGQLAGQSYSSAWGSAVLAALWAWASDEDARTSMPSVVLTTTTQLDYRLRRIAATETARAFADARDEGMGWAAEQYDAARWWPAVLKRWDATLDKKVCKVCRELDGTLRPWGVDFPGGAEPGYVHPVCRCSPTTYLLPIPARAEAAAGHQVDDDHPRDPRAA